MFIRTTTRAANLPDGPRSSWISSTTAMVPSFIAERSSSTCRR
jgi:hypothetical protein